MSSNGRLPYTSRAAPDMRSNVVENVDIVDPKH